MTDITKEKSGSTLSYPKAQITGLILAGGQARRMGGKDKGLVTLGGKTMVEHITTALAPYVGNIIINANRNIPTYQRLGYPVVADEMPEESAGPLSGMASGMRFAKTPYVVVVPCDCPWIPPDLVARLHLALTESGRTGDKEISVAHDGQHLQPVFALLPCSLHESVVEFLDAGERKVALWYARHKTIFVDFSDRKETFFNINTPEDIQAFLSHMHPLRREDRWLTKAKRQKHPEGNGDTTT